MCQVSCFYHQRLKTAKFCTYLLDYRERLMLYWFTGFCNWEAEDDNFPCVFSALLSLIAFSTCITFLGASASTNVISTDAKWQSSRSMVEGDFQSVKRNVWIRSYFVRLPNWCHQWSLFLASVKISYAIGYQKPCSLARYLSRSILLFIWMYQKLRPAEVTHAPRKQITTVDNTALTSS